MRQQINIKHFMILYLCALLIWGAYFMGSITYLWKGLAVVTLYALFDLLWTYAKDNAWYLPTSSIISGFILSIVGAPSPSWGLLILLPLVAVIAKQLIKFGKPRHVFNPASFSMIILSVFGYQAVSWWGAAWGAPVLYVVLLMGLFIIWRQNRWETTISFLVSYAVFLGVLFLWQEREVSRIFLILRPQILDSTTLFFSTVMLIEPITSSFPGTNNRILYGVLVALFSVLVAEFGQFLPYDPIISGLLFGNLIMSLKTGAAMGNL